MLKPIDIHNAEFKRAFKGYNAEEVDAFLAKVVGEYEALFKENQRLQQEVEELKENINKYSDQEQDIQALISMTKESVAEIKELANRQAQALLEEARQKANRIVAEAEEEAAAHRRIVAKLQQKERSFKERMRNVMESFWLMLDEGSDSATANTMDTKVYDEIAVEREE